MHHCAAGRTGDLNEFLFELAVQFHRDLKLYVEYHFRGDL